jgi:hypothetical protein
MFKKLREKRKKTPINQSTTRNYSELFTSQAKRRDASYSRLHQVRKALPVAL